MIRLDGPPRRRGTTVALCDECPPWRELRGTRAAALRAAADHLARVHGQAKRAADLRDQARVLEGRDTPTR